MKESKENVIQVNFRNKGEEHTSMHLAEFTDLLVSENPTIITESYVCDYEEFLEDDLNISLEAYYRNIDEQKMVIEKIIEKDNGVIWHYINNENGLLKISGFYSVKEKIDDRFNYLGIELDKVLEIDGYIILVFQECKVKSNGFSLEDVEDGHICTLEELKNYNNEEFLNALSEERREYLKSFFEEIE